MNRTIELSKTIAVIVFISAAFLVSSCTSTNRIFVNQDAFKEQSTIKLKQSLKGFSDEQRRGLFAPYRVTFKHFYSENNQGAETYVLDISLRKAVRAYELEPVFHISLDGEKLKLVSEEQITKTFQSGSSSSSTERSTSTKVDPEHEDEEISETSTTYTTSSSHDTYQLMHMRFQPDPSLMLRVRSSSDVSHRS